MSISFLEINVNTELPSVQAEIDGRFSGAAGGGRPRRALLIGQRLASGAVDAGEIAQQFTENQGDADFGVGSQLAEMIRAFKQVAPAAELYAVGLDDDAAGVAATGKVTINAGTATETKSAWVRINHRVENFLVQKDDDQDAATAALVAAIGKMARGPVTAAVGVNPNEADLTCRWKGETGNDIQVEVGNLPDGLTASITDMANGATNPDVSAAIAAMGDTQYYTVLCPLIDDANFDALDLEFADRDDADRDLYGRLFAAKRDSLGNLKTWADGKNTRQWRVLAMESANPHDPWLAAATFAAVDHRFGTLADPNVNLPRTGQMLPGLSVPAAGSEFERQGEREQLAAAGLSTYTVNVGRAVIEQVLTLYKQNAQGVDDDTWHYSVVVDLAARLREDWVDAATVRFAGHKAASDDYEVDGGQRVARPKDAAAWTAGRSAAVWQPNGWAEEVEVTTKELVGGNQIHLAFKAFLIQPLRNLFAKQLPVLVR